MRRGWKFFSIAMDHPIHRRMAAIVRACSGDLPAGTRSIVLSVLGPKADGLTRKQAYHLCERMLCSAMRHGFVRRLPARGASDTDRVSVTPFGRRVVFKESLYVATEEGRAFLGRHDKMLAMAGSSPELRGRRGGEARNRSRTVRRYIERMRTGRPTGI